MTRIIESQYCESGRPAYTVRRTWGERLTGRPWRPWVALRYIPARPASIIRMANGDILCHPETARLLRETLR